MADPSILRLELQSLIGQEVVVDVKGDSHFYIGTLDRIGNETIVLTNVDVHFCRDSHATAELYVLQAKENGIRPNRQLVHVMRREVLSMSRLSDIVEY